MNFLAFARGLTVFLAVLFTGIGADEAAAQSGPCDEAVRSHKTLQDLLALVGRLKDANPLWSNYRPAVANYVFIIPGTGQERCALVWRDGAQRSAFPLAAAPRLDTPLYGFFHRDSPQAQPQELRDQFERAGLRDAVIIPLDGDARLGLSMSSRSWFIDMAVHEAVHLLVQFPAQAGADSGFRWPAWTVPQPDRVQLAERCYGSANPKEQRLNLERTPLAAAATTAMAGGPLENVCRDTRAFMTERRRRWSDLSGVAVVSEAGTQSHTCSESEAIMELNEGVPAFVAWMTARQLGVVDDDRLRAQFNVLQRDVFYTTGMMQLTVLHRLLGDQFTEATDRLAASPSLSSGGIFSALEAEVSRQCQ